MLITKSFNQRLLKKASGALKWAIKEFQIAHYYSSSWINRVWDTQGIPLMLKPPNQIPLAQKILKNIQIRIYNSLRKSGYFKKKKDLNNIANWIT